MGVNSHVLPGDIVTTIAQVMLMPAHPDEQHFFDVGCRRLTYEEPCLVLSVASAGSANGGHAFFVMAQRTTHFGWLHNYDVMPYVTQREVSAPMYAKWDRRFVQENSSSKGSAGRSTPT